MVMFTMSKVANVLHLDNPIGIIVLYLGFGAGLSVFIFSGFVKSIPIEIEEAAYRAIAKAAELINLDQHTGEHPASGRRTWCRLYPSGACPWSIA
jgi:preprotein translocase subunit SecY